LYPPRKYSFIDEPITVPLITASQTAAANQKPVLGKEILIWGIGSI